MSTQINTGGPAFPVCFDHVESLSEHPGMSLRDRFAAHETLSDHDHPDVLMPDKIAIALAGPRPEGDWFTNSLEWLKWEALYRARLRYIRADAMLKAREVKL